MYFDPISRRFFLRGLGASLAVPFLPSLLPKAYAAGETPVRFLQYVSGFGQVPGRFFPSDSGLATLAAGVQGKALSSISGEVSHTFGSAFDGIRNKISIIRGLHVLAARNLHNGSIPTCGSGTFTDAKNNGPPVFSYSVDGVIAASNKIYPNPAGKQRFVNFCPKGSLGNYENYSWTVNNGRKEHISATFSSSALLAKFATLTSGGTGSTGGGTGSGPTQTDEQIRQGTVIQSVYNDYKSVRDSGKLSTEDKRNFEAYMQLISEIETELRAPAGGATPTPTTPVQCQNPTLENDSAEDASHRNHAKILVAAMACGLTRVAAYSGSPGYEPMHTWVHEFGRYEGNIAPVQRKMGERIAYVMNLMNQFTEPGGTMLDNSIVYWGTEFGELSNPSNPHSLDSMPAMIGGGGGGRLNQGYFLNFLKTGGMPLNNLLITCFNTMGLSSSDYEREGVKGFGEYDGNRINSKGLAKYTNTDAARRTPLPFVYKGPAMG